MDRRQLLGRLCTTATILPLVNKIKLDAAVAQSAPAGSVAFITGTSSGFGSEMVLVFARAGYRTHATMSEITGRNVIGAAFLREAATREGLSLTVSELDVTDASSARAAVDTVLSREGRIDVLINNAGIFCYTPVAIVPRALWELQMRTNTFAPMELAGLVMPAMRRQGGGLIIQLSSRLGRVVIPGVSLYAASKHALEVASEAAHYESGAWNVDFAILQPTAFATSINANAQKTYRDFTLPLLESERAEGRRDYSVFLDKLDRDFSGAPTRHPSEVAKHALSVALASHSERVLRYAVGDDAKLSAVREVNSLSARVQERALRDAGYGGWRRP